MSFDDYVPSLKPTSPSLSYHQAHRPIISKSITQSSGSQFQKVSSSIFQTKESRSSGLSSQIISFGDQLPVLQQKFTQLFLNFSNGCREIQCLI